MIYRSAAGAAAIEQRYRERLDQWPVPAERLTVPTREGPTFVVACGPPDAPPLVLLHGSGANATAWRYDVPVWSRDFRVYAIDMIGEPGLSAPARPPLDSEAYALWLDDVFGELGVPHAPLAGISLGGWLALDYAVRRPGMVDRLALLCPGGVGAQRFGVVLESLVLRLLGPWGRRKGIELALGVSFAADSPYRDVLDDILLVQRHFRPRMDRLPIFSDAALAGLGMPVLAIVGGRDTMLDSAGTRQRLERSVPEVTVRFLPEAGHLVGRQTEQVLDFLLSDVRSPSGE